MARIEELSLEAIRLPKEQRLALARALLDLEPSCGVAEVERSWDEEIRARIKMAQPFFTRSVEDGDRHAPSAIHASDTCAKAPP